MNGDKDFKYPVFWIRNIKLGDLTGQTKMMVKQGYRIISVIRYRPLFILPTRYMIVGVIRAWEITNQMQR